VTANTALRARFEAKPEDAAAFAALEEALFVAGEWRELVAVYEKRLAAADLAAVRAPKQRARVVLRRAQALDERLADVDEAIAGYREAVALDPTLRPAFAALRRLLAQREDWDAVLALADAEAKLPMRPSERAQLACELGDLWFEKRGDAERARACYERALEAEPAHAPALLGLAGAREASGSHAEAAAALERAIQSLRGAERGRALARLAKLQSERLGEPEKAAENYRRALADDPKQGDALAALAERAESAKQWRGFDELQERRFAIAKDRLARLAIAHDAGRVQLEHARDGAAAGKWFRRALDLFPDDPVVHLYLADVARLSGNQADLAFHLRRATELADNAAPVDALRESAALEAARGDRKRALAQLRRAVERDPADAEASAQLAEALARDGREEEFIELLEARLAERPGGAIEAGLWRQLGAFHERRRDDAATALDAYAQALEAAPADGASLAAFERVARKLERWAPLCERLANAAAASAGDARAALLVQLGELQLEQRGDPAAARASFEAALACAPDDRRARQGIERVALASGDDAALLASFEHEAATTSDRERLAFLVGELARIHEERGDAERALHWLARLAEMRPEDVPTLGQIARLCAARGDAAGELAALRRLDPLVSGALQLTGRRRIAALASESGDAAAALAAHRAVLALEPNELASARAVVALLPPATQAEERAAALRHLVALASGDERSARLYALGCLLAGELGDLQGAGACFEALLDAPNAPADAEDRFAEILRRLGHWDVLCARLDLRRRLLDPLDPRGLELDLERAELLAERLDRADEAIAICESVRDANPRHARARDLLERVLRARGDDRRLVELLEERAAQEADRERRAQLDLERAFLFEQRLRFLPEARSVLSEIAAGESSVAQEAEQRLRQLLEDEGDWPALVSRLEAALASADADAALALHRRLAALQRDRLEDLAAALSHLERALRYAPGDFELMHAQQALLEQSGRTRELCAAFEAELAAGAPAERTRMLHARCADLLEDAGDLAGAERHHLACVALDPGAARAVEFLANRYAETGRSSELAALLRARLAQLGRDREASLSLRLRLASLEANALGDLDAAIETLVPAAADDEALIVVAAPLADALTRAGRHSECAALADRVVSRATSAAERSAWNLRLGDAQRAAGAPLAAADAYRRALADRPSDPDLQAALRDLYRQLGQAEPLAPLLEAELARTAGPREVPLRLELAELLAGPLANPAGALVQYRRVLELEPDNVAALEHAIAAAERAGAAEPCAELLARAAERAADPARRARLLARRGALLAGPLGRPDDAIASYEAALELAPGATETIAALRGVLEDRADWAGVLRCFERELGSLPRDAEVARRAVIDEAVRFASEMIDGEAALPWLERLRAMRPSDAAPIARVAQVHRTAGRPEALLRALEDELALAPPPERHVELALECAQLLRDPLRAPVRAAAVLEHARTRCPGNADLLALLDELYQELGRSRERLAVVNERIALASPAARAPLRKTASALARALGDREASAAQLWAALGECGPLAQERAELLRRLASDVQARPDLWARVAEAELAALDPAAPVFGERRRTLRTELAACYGGPLAAPAPAIAHLSALLDHELRDGEPRTLRLRERAGEMLVAQLRRCGDAVGLARRLALQLAAFPAAAAEPWLELGRLQLELLHQPALAVHSFEAALEREPGSLPALRGRRAACELLGRWREVASSLEHELAVRGDASASERAAILRRLGEVSWRRLDETTRASRAYASALEALPQDLVSLRALQQLFEAMEDWRGAVDLYESEVEALGEDESARRRECQLRAAELAFTHLDEPARALRCMDAAARIAPLATPQLARLAELLERCGERERFAEALAAWIDAPDSHAGAGDELRLADALERLERPGAALARAERAAEREPALADAWDRIAALCERLSRSADAADALVRAAALRSGSEAAQRRVRAADLLGPGAPERCAALLEDATRDDPLAADAFAKLAIAASGAGDVARAQAAAERAIALAAQGSALPIPLRKQAALAGARSALALDQLTSASRLLGDLLALDPDHAEALGQHGRTLLRLGDVAGARRVLARALELPGAARDRAVLLALLGSAEAAAQADDIALAHFREALSIEPTLDEAHAGLVQLHMRASREADAVAALLTWAGCARTPRERAERLLQAGELELSRAGREAEAERLLREAAGIDAALASAWALLAELLAKQGRWSELIDCANAGEAASDDSRLRSRLGALRGRALEQRGELRAAAEAFAAASRHSPRASEAAHSAARLLRGLGEWQAAADVLRDFAERAPDDAVAARATALHQLGRLLAGPLEDVDGAVEVYRRAVALDSDNRECAEALADLLLHRPRHWDEAIARHAELLARDPTRLASLRGLLRVARGRGNASAASSGLVLLRALGAATAEEAREAPARWTLAIAAKPQLLDARFELARRLAHEAAAELGEALHGAQAGGVSVASGEGSARFRAAVTATEGELSAPALVPLSTTELARALTLLAELAAEVETVSSADGGLVNALSQAIGWRARKRIKRALEGHAPDEIASLDFATWRRSLRALASAVVIDRGDCALRDAFLAWIQSDDPESGRTLPPEVDLRARIAAQPEARELLGLVVRAWIASL
jgi:tetratricopeptide (TPR) repeat protein